jgi:hypothetical protein
LAPDDLEIILSDRFRERFNRRRERVRGGCIEWRGSTNGNGYGKVRVRAGLTIPTHCAAWIMHYRVPIPEHLELDHRCVNTLCTYVYHLQAVTHDENVRRANERRGIGTVRSATIRLRAGKYQVRWRELVDGQIKQRGRTFDTSDEAQRFMAGLAEAA